MNEKRYMTTVEMLEQGWTGKVPIGNAIHDLKALTEKVERLESAIKVKNGVLFDAYQELVGTQMHNLRAKVAEGWAVKGEKA